MGSNMKYVPTVEKFLGSDEFSYLAKFYNEHGVYTTLTEDTFQWKEFWIQKFHYNRFRSTYVQQYRSKTRFQL